MIRCELCGGSFFVLNDLHLWRTHGVRTDEYGSRFPGETFSDETKEALSVAMSGPKPPGFGETVSRGLNGRSDEEKAITNSKISQGLIGNTNRLGKPKSKEECEAISRAHTGKPLTEEHKANVGEATRRRLADPEYYQRFCETMSNRWDVPGYREKMSKLHTEQWKDPQYRKMMEEANLLAYSNPERGKHISEGVGRYWNTPGNRENRSEYWKKRWAEDKEYQSNQAKANNRRPNFDEVWLGSILERNFPNEWRYVGNGEVVIGGKCPDFLHISDGLIIEMFGGYWHKEEEIDSRTKHFEGYGHRVLVIWDYELLDKDLVNRIKAFRDLDKKE